MSSQEERSRVAPLVGLGFPVLGSFWGAAVGILGVLAQAPAGMRLRDPGGPSLSRVQSGGPLR